MHLEPEADRELDLVSLIRAGVPDDRGARLPSNLIEGSALIENATGELRVMQIASTTSTFNVRTATCNNSCGTCSGVASGAVKPNPLGVNIYTTAQAHATLTYGTGTLEDVGKGAVAIVPVQLVLSPVGDEQVLVTVIVVVAHADAACPATMFKAGLVRHIGEGAVAIVPVEAVGGAGRRVRDSMAAEQENIHPAIVFSGICNKDILNANPPPDLSRTNSDGTAQVGRSRRFETRDDSRNNWWVALLPGGEGLHNNRYAHPVSARQGLTWLDAAPVGSHGNEAPYSFF